jgi:hypothetical protein
MDAAIHREAARGSVKKIIAGCGVADLHAPHLLPLLSV